MNKKDIEQLLMEEIKNSLTDSGILKKETISEKEPINESYVTEAPKFDLKTELLSQKNKNAHQQLLEGYVKTLNEISAKLDTANRDDANLNHSEFRSLKLDETYNYNAAFLHGLFLIDELAN